MIGRPVLDAMLARIRRHLFLKVVGTAAFIWIFFVGYFHVLRNPLYEVTVMPVLRLDRWVDFQPIGLVPYLSLWFYVGIPPSLLAGFRELVAYGVWAAALCLAGLAIFHFWPTAIPAPDIDTLRYPGFEVLQGLDAAGNACPSLHVATAMFSALWLDRLLREIGTGRAALALNWGWFAAIAWSTMAIKQHVALDVLGGVLLGLAFALPSLRLRPAG